MKYYVGVDLGGMSIKTGVLDENFNILGNSTVPTDLPKSPDEIIGLIEKSIELALKDGNISKTDIQWVGIGLPAILGKNNRMIHFSSNLGFRDVPIAEMAEERLKLPVYLENDANSAIYGEMLNGSAKGCKDVVMLTLGTGVGGGVIIDGKIYSGYNGQGAELGHVGMVYDGHKCLCGHTGCIEMYCSATALKNQTKKAMEENKDSQMWDMVSGEIDKVNGKTAFNAAEKNDKTALAVVNQYIDYLGFAVTNYINIFQPEMIIIGGGISYQKDRLLNPVREYAKKHSLGYTEESHTKIETVTLGNDAGVIGAAFLGKLVASENEQ